MSDPNVEKRADWYFEMMKHSYAACSQRRNLVWHLSISLWTVLGLLVISAVRGELREWVKEWEWSFVGCLPGIHLAAGVLYLIAIIVLQRTDKSDSDYANNLQCTLAKFISNPVNGLATVDLPGSMGFWESIKRGLGNWAAGVQLVVTGTLLIGSYSALSAVVS